MTEQFVAFTDYLLAILTLFYAWKLHQTAFSSHPFKKAWILFFLSVSMASLWGGIVHGFFSNQFSNQEEFGIQHFLWILTLLSIGLMACSLFFIDIFMICKGTKTWIIQIFLTIAFLGYSFIIICKNQEFLMAVYFYFPSLLLLLVISFVKWLKTRERGFLELFLGVILALVAAYIQQSKRSIHPIYANHNVLYHLIQGISLWRSFRGAKALSSF